ncbi:hypothetical protein RvY_15439 [Ramazzottius varieornatus]|uniref:Uncharacterized protein n=1 Tax=Ramazzottius varieornatus TaxID=947166 RepID=A0A1D1W1Q8_RAMVA|nr:hypothetical protein RvY_15439 [Ramazzottius varieornatus]
MIHPRVRDVFMSEVFWKSFVATSASLLCITGGAFLAYTKITQKRRRELDEIYKKRRGDVHHMQRIRHLYGLQLEDNPYLNSQDEDTPETELENPATAET